jgi:hypothetical protein
MKKPLVCNAPAANQAIQPAELNSITVDAAGSVHIEKRISRRSFASEFRQFLSIPSRFSVQRPMQMTCFHSHGAPPPISWMGLPKPPLQASLTLITSFLIWKQSPARQVSSIPYPHFSVEGVSGMRMTAFRPPSTLSPKVISPPCPRMMSRVIDKPSPVLFLF